MFNKLSLNDTFLRILSVLIAVILWMYVVGVRNPQVSVIVRNVPVEIKNQAGISGRNLKIIDVSDTSINVRVVGRRSDVGTVSAEDISLSVDASKISSPGEYTLDVSGSISRENAILKLSDKNRIKIYVDQIITVEKNIDARVTGEPAPGFIFGDTVMGDSTVVIEGPKSVLEGLGSVNVNVDVSAFTKSVTQLFDINLYDVGGNPVDMTYITLDKNKTLVKIPIYKTKIVKIIPNVTGADDKTVTVSPSEITVYGESKDIDLLNTIKTSKTEVFSNGEYDVGLSVPDGIYLKEEITSVKLKVSGAED